MNRCKGQATSVLLQERVDEGENSDNPVGAWPSRKLADMGLDLSPNGPWDRHTALGHCPTDRKVFLVRSL